MPDQSSVSELGCTYAALILHDAGAAINAAAINKIVAAAGVQIEAFWPTLFERVLKNHNLDDIILSAGAAPSGPTTGGSTAGPATGGAGGGSAPPPEAAPVEEKKEESEEMEFDLFG